MPAELSRTKVKVASLALGEIPSVPETTSRISGEDQRVGAPRGSLGRLGESADDGACDRGRAGRLLPEANAGAVSEVGACALSTS
jgi:hypothetical protein